MREIFACIPLSSDIARVARGVQLLRLVRVMRLLRVARLAARVHVLVSASRSLLIDRSLLYVTTTSSVIVFSAALGFHYFEDDRDDQGLMIIENLSSCFSPLLPTP